MKFDLPSNNPTVLAQYARYSLLYTQASKTSSEIAELAALQITLADYLTTATEINTLNAHLSDYTLQVPYVATSGSVNAYVATLSPALTSYVAGVALAVNINITNTGASTINVNGLGVKNIVNAKGVAMSAGKLTASGVYTLRYNGTAFIVQGEGAYGNAVASDLLSGKTAGSDVGDIVGTITVVAGGNTITPSASTQTAIAASTYSTSAISVAAVTVPVANVLVGTTIAGQTGTGTNAKRYASGTVTSDNTLMFYTTENSGGIQLYKVDVSGLNFPNSIGSLRIYNVFSGTSTHYSSSHLSLQCYVYVNVVGVRGNIRPASPNAVVSTTGFSMPVELGSTSYQWEAWEA